MITQERLKELLHYNPDTGIFTNRITRSSNAIIGNVSGCVYNSNGKTYRLIRIDNTNYRVHRLAWLYITGSFPNKNIDHIDGDGTNNKFSNLRSVDQQENQRNKRKYANNKSGLSGVFFNRTLEKWEAHIGIHGRRKYLGVFDDKFEAICAKKSAESKYRFHQNHGQNRPL